MDRTARREVRRWPEGIRRVHAARRPRGGAFNGRIGTRLVTNTDDPTVDRLRGAAPPRGWPVEPMYQYPLKVMRLRARIAEQSEPDTRRVIQRGWRSGLPSVYHRLELERDRVRDACRVTSGLPPEIVRQFMRLDLLQHTCRVEFGAAQHWRPTRQQYAPARILGVPLRKG